MILVADSGSSKTDWRGSYKEEIYEFNTPGINPYFLNSTEIAKVLAKDKNLIKHADKVREIYFFGAGSSSPDKHEIISNGLSGVFVNAYICVDNDLIGSAYATCGEKAGYTCILGTGSNVSFYDGQEVHHGKRGLGYILGDEGSGTWFGKKLLVSWLYKQMPANLSIDFAETYALDKSSIITNVYMKPFPNIYLASFTRFMSKHINHPFIQNLLTQGFQEFVDTNLKDQDNPNNLPFNFVGSIAYHFQDKLKAVCTKNNIRVGNIIQKPIDSLFQYILKREDIAFTIQE